MHTLALALRNLGRNLRRTAITLSAIALGLAVMVWIVVLQAGQHEDMRQGGIATLAGHVVVQDPAWQTEREPEQVVADADAIATTLAAAFPQAQITRRIWLAGLLSSPTSSTAAAVALVDPGPEAAVHDVEEQIVDGTWLDATDDRGIVLGVGLARSLGVTLGDKVVLMGQFGQPEIQSRLFRVRGLFRTGAAEVDGFTAWANLTAGQELLGKPHAAHQIAVHLPPGADDVAAAAEARARVPGPAAVLHWRDALPDLWALIAIDARSNDVILGVFGLIVAIGVLNTVLMSVLERSREFGVLLAIGMRPGRIARLVLTEALVLGVIGGTLGMALGIALAYPLVTHGIDFSASMGERMEAGGVLLKSVVKGRYDVPRLSGYYVGAILFTALAGLYPAWQVTRFTPVEAMRKA